MIGFAASALAVDVPLRDWPAPATWSTSAAQGAKGLLSETNPLPLVAVTPCRIADTRNAAGPYGGPELAANMTRNFTIPGV